MSGWSVWSYLVIESDLGVQHRLLQGQQGLRAGQQLRGLPLAGLLLNVGAPDQGGDSDSPRQISVTLRHVLTFRNQMYNSFVNIISQNIRDK